MSNTSSAALTAQALRDDPQKRGTRSKVRKARIAKDTEETQKIIDELSALEKPFTVVSAYLRFPDKNPSAFIQKLEILFEEKILVSEKPTAILKQLNKAWDQCVKADSGMPFNPSAPHVFLGAIHQKPELWNAELKIGTVPQTLFLPPARLSYDG